jgi:hypothetical protein
MSTRLVSLILRENARLYRLAFPYMSLVTASKPLAVREGQGEATLLLSFIHSFIHSLRGNANSDLRGGLYSCDRRVSSSIAKEGGQEMNRQSRP